MAREAKIYFQDQLAGYLIEGDRGYTFHYDKTYMGTADATPTLTSLLQVWEFLNWSGIIYT